MKQKDRQLLSPLTEFMFAKANREKIPISGTFELTPVCNFSCRMCYVHKTAREAAEHPRPVLTLEQWMRIAEEARKEGMLYILLTGGEPLLWPDFWILYENLCRMGFIVSVNTNGSLIDSHAIECFKRNPPRRINISLYGVSDSTYEALCQVKGMFSRVDRAITGLQEAGITVKLNGTLTPYNVCDLEAMVDYAEKRKLILQTTTYMFPPIRRNPSMVGRNERFSPDEAAFYQLECYRLQYGEEKYISYLERIREGFVDPPGLDEACRDPVDGKICCSAGRAAFWVTWDGWLTPCGMMPEPRIDLASCPFDQVWKEITEICAELCTSGICIKCPNQNICHACAAMALTETGRISGIPRYLCEVSGEMKRIANQALNK